MSVVLEPSDKDRMGFHTSGTTDCGNISVGLAQRHPGQPLWRSAGSARSQAGTKSLQVAEYSVRNDQA